MLTAAGENKNVCIYHQYVLPFMMEHSLMIVSLQECVSDAFAAAGLLKSRKFWFLVMSSHGALLPERVGVNTSRLT